VGIVHAWAHCAIQAVVDAWDAFVEENWAPVLNSALGSAWLERCGGEVAAMLELAAQQPKAENVFPLPACGCGRPHDAGPAAATAVDAVAAGPSWPGGGQRSRAATTSRPFQPPDAACAAAASDAAGCEDGCCGGRHLDKWSLPALADGNGDGDGGAFYSVEDLAGTFAAALSMLGCGSELEEGAGAAAAASGGLLAQAFLMSMHCPGRGVADPSLTLPASMAAAFSSFLGQAPPPSVAGAWPESSAPPSPGALRIDAALLAAGQAAGATPSVHDPATAPDGRPAGAAAAVGGRPRGAEAAEAAGRAAAALGAPPRPRKRAAPASLADTAPDTDSPPSQPSSPLSSDRSTSKYDSGSRCSSCGDAGAGTGAGGGGCPGGVGGTAPPHPVTPLARRGLLDCVDAWGRSPLHVAAAAGRADVAAELLQGGCSCAARLPFDYRRARAGMPGRAGCCATRTRRNGRGCFKVALAPVTGAARDTKKAKRAGLAPRWLLFRALRSAQAPTCERLPPGSCRGGARRTPVPFQAGCPTQFCPSVLCSGLWRRRSHRAERVAARPRIERRRAQRTRRPPGRRSRRPGHAAPGSPASSTPRRCTWPPTMATRRCWRCGLRLCQRGPGLALTLLLPSAPPATTV
jgi:hypothetical protein